MQPSKSHARGEAPTLARQRPAVAQEIKKRTGSSEKHMNAGSSLVLDPGKTVDELVHSVKRLTELMGEIASASNEQSTGIEQINVMVSQMDKLAQQTAVRFEHASPAAQATAEHENSLRRAVAVFKASQC
jgi:methyl-accepting chemotaxis protein